MAVYRSKDVAFLLVDGYSILGVNTQVRDNKEVALEETHALGDEWVKQESVGLKRASFEQNGFYDDAAGGNNAALAEKQGLSRLLCYGVEGNTIGKRFVGFEGAMQVNYERIATRGELHKANARYEGSGQVDEGHILHALKDETDDGDTEDDSVDNGASSASGGAGYLQVTSLVLGGYDDITVKIRHSADDQTYADLITFADVNAAPAKERKTVTSTVNRYLAASWAFNGTGSNPNATFFVGFARG